MNPPPVKRKAPKRPVERVPAATYTPSTRLFSVALKGISPTKSTTASSDSTEEVPPSPKSKRSEGPPPAVRYPLRSRTAIDPPPPPSTAVRRPTKKPRRKPSLDIENPLQPENPTSNDLKGDPAAVRQDTALDTVLTQTSPVPPTPAPLPLVKEVSTVSSQLTKEVSGSENRSGKKKAKRQKAPPTQPTVPVCHPPQPEESYTVVFPDDCDEPEVVVTSPVNVSKSAEKALASGQGRKKKALTDTCSVRTVTNTCPVRTSTNTSPVRIVTDACSVLVPVPVRTLRLQSQEEEHSISEVYSVLMDDTLPEGMAVGDASPSPHRQSQLYQQMLQKRPSSDVTSITSNVTLSENAVAETAPPSSATPGKDTKGFGGRFTRQTSQTVPPTEQTDMAVSAVSLPPSNNASHSSLSKQPASPGSASTRPPSSTFNPSHVSRVQHLPPLPTLPPPPTSPRQPPPRTSGFFERFTIPKKQPASAMDASHDVRIPPANTLLPPPAGVWESLVAPSTTWEPPVAPPVAWEPPVAPPVVAVSANRFSRSANPCLPSPNTFNMSGGSVQFSSGPVDLGPYKDLFQKTFSKNVKFIDAHTHLCFTLNKLEGGGVSTYGEMKRRYKELFPQSYGGAVQVFCHRQYLVAPLQWNERVMEGTENEVWFSYGLHPNWADEWSEEVREGMEESMRLAKSVGRLVAVGEIGLDYSRFNSAEEKRAKQREILAIQLQMAVKENLPIVIHCRNDEGPTGNNQADLDCLQIIKQYVRQEHHIHRHCFTGSYEEAQRWREYYPNVAFGFTPAKNGKNSPAQDAIRKLPLESILLETDAPYFTPTGMRNFPTDKNGNRVSIPGGIALVTADEIARLKDIPLEEVVTTTTANVRHVYGIQL